MKRLLFILVIISIIIYFQYNFINKTNNSYEILQYRNPKKNIFENVLNEKLISVFTDIKFDNWNNIENNLFYYNIPLLIESNYTINIENKNQTSLIKKQDKYRRLFYVVSGTKRFLIFNKNQAKNLYLNNNNTSPVNIFNQDLKKYPNLKNIKYIEVIVRENTMIYIPYNFYFCYICDENTKSYDLYSESIFSKFLKT